MNADTAFPPGSAGRLYSRNSLPERLKNHGAILAISSMPRDPVLNVSQISQVIVGLSGTMPRGGWSAVAAGAGAVLDGGQCWLRFDDDASAEIFIGSIIPKLNISIPKN